MVRRIEKIAVIGSGIMGGGIAALCAGAGIKTIMLDIVPFNLNENEKKDPKARNKVVQAGLDAQLKARPSAFMDKKNDLNFLTTGNLEDDFNRLSECDLILEVVVENLKIKQELFAKIEKIKKRDAIVASNTSGLPLKSMVTGRTKNFKEHFLITHFFNPVRYMKLLECVAGPETKKEICEFIENWGEKVLGKGIVWAKDTPNFIGNRIGVQLICEAFKLIESEDITVKEIDDMFGPAFGMPNTGVFALADLVGLDTIGHLSKNSYELLKKDERRDIYQLPKFVLNMIEKKMFGNKTKEQGGFYKTEVDPKTWKKNKKFLDVKKFEFVNADKDALPACVKEAKEKTELAEKQQTIIFGSSKESKIALKLFSSVLIYAANRIPEISNNIVGIDNAMKWGYAWQSGPFEIWDSLGVKKLVTKMNADGLAVPDNVEKMLKKGNKTFYKIKNGKRMYYDFKSGSYKEVVVSDKIIFLSNIKADKRKIVKSKPSASLIDLGDGVFNLEFHSKMNAVNIEMVHFIMESGEYVLKNGVGLVMGNQAPGTPGAFSAGGDLSYMLGLAKARKFTEIDSFIKDVHAAILGSKYASYPVVAAPYGMTLGGGCETCLAADRIVAHADLYMGLVEIGAGLVPGGCGMLHLWQRSMDSVPANVKLADYGAYLIPAFMLVAQAQVSTSAAEARNNGFLRPADRIIFNKDYLIGEAKKEVLKMLDDGYTPPAKKKYPAMGQEAQGMIWAEMLNLTTGGFLTKHMETIAKKAAYCITGGEARQGQLVSEDYLCKLEREAFVDLWKTEETRKMAEHMMKTGKPLMI